MKDNPGCSQLSRPALDEAALDKPVAERRNFYFGKWAGRQLGLTGRALEVYTLSVIVADYDEPGDEDIIRKVTSDFAFNGERTTREELEHQLRRSYQVATRQFGMPR